MELVGLPLESMALCIITQCHEEGCEEEWRLHGFGDDVEESSLKLSQRDSGRFRELLQGLRQADSQLLHLHTESKLLLSTLRKCSEMSASFVVCSYPRSWHAHL